MTRPHRFWEDRLAFPKPVTLTGISGFCILYTHMCVCTCVCVCVYFVIYMTAKCSNVGLNGVPGFMKLFNGLSSASSCHASTPRLSLSCGRTSSVHIIIRSQGLNVVQQWKTIFLCRVHFSNWSWSIDYQINQPTRMVNSIGIHWLRVKTEHYKAGHFGEWIDL